MTESRTRVCQIPLGILENLLGEPSHTKHHFTDVAKSGQPQVIRMVQWRCGCRALSIQADEVPVVPCEFHVPYLRFD
ncbi:MAG: hypothetical protein ABR949_11675 [Candidatus Aquilonibacter sp.]